jgi:hypothetical protein
VEVDVQIQPSTEALDNGHAPGKPVPDPAPPRLLTLKAKEHPHVDAEHGPAERVIPGEQVAEAGG